jgi:hypothetical protein
MDIKTIFRIAIKLMGVYFVFGTTLDVILQSTLNLTADYTGYDDYAFNTKLYAIVDIAFWILMPLVLVFKTDTVMGALDILKGFGEITLSSFNEANIMKAGLIFIGGFCIIDHLPTVITLGIMYIKEVASGSAPDYQGLLGVGNTTYRLISEGISLLFGIVVLTNYDRLTRALMPGRDTASV